MPPWTRAQALQAGAQGRKAMTITHAQRVQWGREGGAVRQLLHRSQIITRFAHLDRDAAIWAAWQAGSHAGRQARRHTRGAA